MLIRILRMLTLLGIINLTIYVAITPGTQILPSVLAGFGLAVYDRLCHP